MVPSGYSGRKNVGREKYPDGIATSLLGSTRRRTDRGLQGAPAHNDSVFRGISPAIKTWESIEGWLTDAEASGLRDCVREFVNPPVIVELGSYFGRSTVVLAQELIERFGRPFGKADLPKLYAVDRWIRTPEVCPGYNLGGSKCVPGVDYMAPVVENMKEMGLLFFVQPIRALTTEVSRMFEDMSVDMIFHDASHDEASVRLDLDAWVNKLCLGGVWAHHDHHQSGGRVIDGCDQLERKIVRDSLWVGRRVR